MYVWGGAIKIGVRPYMGRGVFVLGISNRKIGFQKSLSPPLMYYFCMRYCYHYDSKNLYNYLHITLFNSFNSSTFRFTMGLVLILLMNRYRSLCVKLQIPPLSSAASVIILWYLSVSFSERQLWPSVSMPLEQLKKNISIYILSSPTFIIVISP